MRFIYNGNGRELDSVTDMSVLLGEDEKAEVQKGLEIDSLGVGVRIDKIYLTLATAVIGRIKAGALQKRTLKSGLMAFTTERNVRLEPGIEAVMPELDTVAHNYNDISTVPEGIHPYSFDHTLWVAQSLLDYDFGVQAQRHQLALVNEVEHSTRP